MRLSLSRHEVDYMLKLIIAELDSLKSPSNRTVNLLSNLQHKLIAFRNQVWDTEYKEV